MWGTRNTQCCRRLSCCIKHSHRLVFRTIRGSDAFLFQQQMTLKTRGKDQVTQKLRLLQLLAFCPPPVGTPLHHGLNTLLPPLQQPANRTLYNFMLQLTMLSPLPLQRALTCRQVLLNLSLRQAGRQAAAGS